MTGRELPLLREVADWLRRNAPSDPKTTLVHGDFRPGNVLFAGTDRPEIAGVLDWETAMLATVWEDLHRHQIEAGTESDWEPHIDYMSMIAHSIVSGEFRL